MRGFSLEELSRVSIQKRLREGMIMMISLTCQPQIHVTYSVHTLEYLENNRPFLS